MPCRHDVMACRHGVSLTLTACASGHEPCCCYVTGGGVRAASCRWRNCVRGERLQRHSSVAASRRRWGSADTAAAPAAAASRSQCLGRVSCPDLRPGEFQGCRRICLRGKIKMPMTTSSIRINKKMPVIVKKEQLS